MATPTFDFPIIGKFPTHKISKPIFYGFTVTQVRVQNTFVGSPLFLISGDGGSNWQEVTSLVSGESKNVTITVTGTSIIWKAIGKPTYDTMSKIIVEAL